MALAFVAARHIASDVYRELAESLIQSELTPDATREQNVETLEHGVNLLLKAQQFNSENPDLNLDLGDLYLRLAALFPQPKSQQIAQLSVDQYRQALKKRPTWPYAWINLANAQRKALAPAQAVFASLERAMTLGPWELTLQLGVLRLGMPMWGGWSAEQKRLLRGAMGRVATAPDLQNKLVLAVLRYGLESELRFAVNESPEIIRAINALKSQARTVAPSRGRAVGLK
ncbi:hypothetical protein [Magnetofaba australis]|uniref:hypothetical protein n=1 Tax=Magnetofaba australis TaxID=1472297 RepID=UPI00117E9F62|nr:hypothetical protein [Magnetofaba australis]